VYLRNAFDAGVIKYGKEGVQERSMVTVSVSIDEDVLEVLKTLAEMQGISVEEVLQERVMADISRIKARMNDPLIGALSDFSQGDNDVASIADDIIRDERKPD
jgi:hypothetical protein